MGTTARVKVWAADSATCDLAVDAAFAALVTVDRDMSTYRSDSQLTRLNRDGAGGWVQVGEPLLEVLTASDRFSQLTNGAFDPTVFPLIHLWGFRDGPLRLPTDEEIERTLRVTTGIRHLVLDLENGRARFESQGVSIDLGGIAKGYALDIARIAALEAGAFAGLVDLGGNLISFGKLADGLVAIQHPMRSGEILGSFRLAGESVATSGGYENFVTIKGKKFGHIIDPRTGHPASGTESVTIVAAQGMAADALSTACFVMGPEACLGLISELENTECVLVWLEGDSLNVRVSEGLTLIAPRSADVD